MMKNSNSLIKKPGRLFWSINITGWLLVVFVNIVFQTRYFQENFDAISYSFLIASVGFTASIVLRYTILKLQLIDKKFVIALLYLFGITVLSAVVSVIIFTIAIVSFFPAQTFSFGMLLGNMFNFSLMLFIWTLTYAGYLFFENQQNLAKQKLSLSLQLKQAELNNLRKQLSPHFLFNSINNIRSLILIDPEKARDALLDISDLLRYALNYQKKQSVSVKEEMEIVQGYINLNRIHLGKNVLFDVVVDKELMELTIPPMSIQLLVENAIKHGDLSQSARITVKVKQAGEYSLIEVSNPGSLKASDPIGIGLENLKQRLEDLFENRYAFEIFENNRQVTAQILIQ